MVYSASDYQELVETLKRDHKAEYEEYEALQAKIDADEQYAEDFTEGKVLEDSLSPEEWKRYIELYELFNPC
jgi:hypothetical protein